MASCLPNNSESTGEDDEVKLVPVHKDDFKKINEFAEAAWIYRDPDNSDNIKEIRRNLLREVVYLAVFFIYNTFVISAQCSSHQNYPGERRKEKTL